MRLRLLLIAALLVGLSSCASPPATITYYMLTPAQDSAVTANVLTDKPALVIESVELSEFLRQSGLVMQTGTNQLNVSKNHLWAESLDQALPKALLRELQKQSQNYAYYLKFADYVGRTDFRVRLHVDNLQPTDQGEVIAAGRYQLIAAMAPDQPVSANFYFTLELEQDGYTHAVNQMQVLLGRIAAAILASTDALAKTAATAQLD